MRSIENGTEKPPRGFKTNAYHTAYDFHSNEFACWPKNHEGRFLMRQSQP